MRGSELSEKGTRTSWWHLERVVKRHPVKALHDTGGMCTTVHRGTDGLILVWSRGVARPRHVCVKVGGGITREKGGPCKAGCERVGVVEHEAGARDMKNGECSQTKTSKLGKGVLTRMSESEGRCC